MKIAPLLLLPCIIDQAHAFDVWGFHSGMSEEQVIALAHREGYEVRMPSGELAILPRSRFLSLIQRGAQSVPEPVYITGFCDDKLTWVSHGYKSNIAILFDLLNDLKAKYGEPKADTASQVLSGGQARGINFNFRPKPDDVVSIEVTLDMNTDTSFGIEVEHHNTQMVCR